jgi:hypothetical protein
VTQFISPTELPTPCVFALQNIQINTEMPERYQWLEQWLREHDLHEQWMCALKRLSGDRSIRMFGLHPERLSHFVSGGCSLLIDCIFERDGYQLIGGIHLEVIENELLVSAHT